MKLKGRVHVFGENINTDEIIPARYLNTSDPQELAKHCMEDADKDFMSKMVPGDIIVAGKNFGCGSSREHAPIALKAAKVSLIIAPTFARIFFRNAINIGLPILECKEAAENIKSGDEVEVDLDTGAIQDVTTGRFYNAQKYPEFMKELISEGGLMPWVQKRKQFK
ncbi:MAG: 3-isopropylmalate dehydratase small subunit [Candidatus Omnitrophica bacterium]|nr:3-isopropylmalate dehydratase small subunit [Candidatus Omnitrophota bacterium]